MPIRNRSLLSWREDEFDALLYLGPLTSMTKAHLDRGLCTDRAYLDMRLGRLSLLGVTPAPSRLKEYCANANDGGIADLAPHLTEAIRAVIRDAAIGVVDSTRIAPEARDRVVPLLRNIGARFLKPYGPLDSLVLLSESNEGGKRTRRYRAVFSHGQGKSLWTVVFSSSDLIDSIDPRPE